MDGPKPLTTYQTYKMIEEISGFAEGLYDAHKFPVHCSNIGNHATKLNELLGEENCTIHERGNLMRTIETFVKNDKRYLLIAGAEYGANFDWSKIQFILKYPFAGFDDRVRVLEKTMGKEKFNAWYNGDARIRLIQQVGRNCRGFGDFGATIILDSKFMEDYKQNKMLYPDWFRQSFDGVVY